MQARSYSVCKNNFYNRFFQDSIHLSIVVDLEHFNFVKINRYDKDLIFSIL